LLRTTEAHMSHLRINEGFGPRFLPFSFFEVNVVSFAHGRAQNALKKAVRQVG
jgi:hypothetical protein